MGQPLHQYFVIHYQELKRFLDERVSCSDTINELIQEIFLKLSDSNVEYDKKSARKQIFQTASELVKRNKRRSATGENEKFTPLPDQQDSVENQALSTEEIAILKRAIDELPRTTRSIFLLHKFNNLSYQEVADELQITKNQVTAHMARALSYCRHRLDEYRRN